MKEIETKVTKEILDGIDFLLTYLDCNDSLDHASDEEKKGVKAVGEWYQSMVQIKTESRTE